MKNIMKQMSDEDAYDLLHGAGFSLLETYQLIKVSRNYAASKLNQANPPQAQPQFVRRSVQIRKPVAAVLYAHVG